MIAGLPLTLIHLDLLSKYTTLTFIVMNNSKLIIFTIAGENKKDMAQRIIEEPEYEISCQRVRP
jgi:6-phosphogluconolactonase/glucosamine-6-phosphate isomerase/deaminase